MKNRPLFFGLTGMIIFLVALCGGQAVAAQSLPSRPEAGGSPECWPLDVVVLIDESLSMSKVGGNDPDGYRFLAAKEILNLLISNRRAQCTDAEHRLGVIFFTDVVSTVVPLKSIDISATDDREAWSQEIVNAIQSGMPNNLKNGTDPALAFRAADTLLNQAPPTSPLPSGYAQRRQVIILLTDGNPEGTNVGDVGNYMRRLSNDLSAPGWSRRSIWIVALNAKYLSAQAFEGKTMRQVWTEIATTHNGRLLGEDSYDKQTIPAALGQIIDEEFGQPGIKIQCGDFYVDPYLQSVRFVFSKRLEHQDKLVILSKLDDVTGEPLYRYFDGKIELINASSQMVFQEDLYRRDGIIEEYSFNFPLPGRWNFTIEGLSDSECRLGVDARQTPRVAEVRLIEPADVVAQSEAAPYYDTEAPISLKVRLEAMDGQPIPLPDYPLTMTAILRLPSGKTQLPDDNPLPTYTFARTAENLWQSDPAFILAPEVGTYTLHLSGVSVHHNPPESSTVENYAVFTTTLSYEVKKLGRLRFVIQSPAEGESIPCNTVQERKAVGRPVPITIQLLDPNGQAADAEYYLTSDLVQSFEATLLDIGGNPLDTVSLAPAARGIGLFEGRLMTTPSVVGCGLVSAQVRFKGSVDDTRFALPGRTQTVTFNRLQSEGVLIAVSAPQMGQRFLLHPNLCAACKNVLVPVTLIFGLTDLDDKALPPTDVANGTPESLYTASLIAPDGMREELNLAATNGVFSATGGLTMTQTGNYRFEIIANQDAFKEGYVSGDTTPVTISLERYDTPWTNPLTCKIVAISSTALLVFLVGLIIYLLTGAPGGTLEIIEFGRPTEIVAGPFGLRGGRFPTISGRGLPGMGIKQIRTQKARSMEGNARAVKVVIRDINGQDVFEGILEVDQPVPLAVMEGRDLDLVYR